MSSKNKISLGVNVDHIATLRQARGINYPDPVYAALICEQHGADFITVHLREDRRHIQDDDVITLQNKLQTRLNLELAAVDAMVDFACKVKPSQCCVVPEKREELTTEGGLDIVNNFYKIKDSVTCLKQAGIRVSLFIDPCQEQLHAAKEVMADEIEIHTGKYAECVDHSSAQLSELEIIKSAVMLGNSLDLGVNAGHGLNYHNVAPVAAIKGIAELNIGHAIVARAVITGITEAVMTMKKLILEASL